MTQNLGRSKTRGAGLALGALVGLFALPCTPVVAQSAPSAAQRASVLDDLSRCRAIADGTQRLACYDTAAGAIDHAERTGDVVVLDRTQVRETRRRLFGLDLDSVNIFNRGERPERVDSIESTLARASGGDRGQPWMFELADGSVWRQIDGERLRTNPRPGVPVSIRRAAVGSYLMNVNGARALRVRRDR